MSDPFQAFQPSAFQNSAFQVGGGLTSTKILQNPVDYFMVKEQDLKEYWNEYDVHDPNVQHRTIAQGSGLVQLDDGGPSYTTTTSTRGYD